MQTMKNLKEIVDKIDKNFVKKNASKVQEKDIVNVFEKADEIEEKFSNNGLLKRFIKDGKLLIEVIKDYRAGMYKKIPYWVIGAIVFTLIYVLNPMDAVFDLIPGIGHLDDAAVIGICLYLIEQELLDYKKWKSTTSS